MLRCALHSVLPSLTGLKARSRVENACLMASLVQMKLLLLKLLLLGESLYSGTTGGWGCYKSNDGWLGMF